MVDRKIKALFIYLVSCDGSCEIINSILVQTCLVSKGKGKSRDVSRAVKYLHEQFSNSPKL